MEYFYSEVNGGKFIKYFVRFMSFQLNYLLLHAIIYTVILRNDNLKDWRETKEDWNCSVHFDILVYKAISTVFRQRERLKYGDTGRNARWWLQNLPGECYDLEIKKLVFQLPVLPGKSEICPQLTSINFWALLTFGDIYKL